MANVTTAETKTENKKPEVSEKNTREWAWWDDNGKLVKLQEAWAIGASDSEACYFADITQDQLYYYTREINPDFQVLKTKLKQKPILMARQETVKGFKDNPEFCLKYLERKLKKEFSLRQEFDHTTDGEKINEVKLIIDWGNNDTGKEDRASESQV